MVVGLFKKLFNVRDKTTQAKFGSSSSLKQQQKLTQTKANTVNATVAHNTSVKAEQNSAAEVDLSSLFYGLLFSQQSHAMSGIANNLERRVMADIEIALSSVKDIAETVLKLPSKIIELDKKLADETIENKELLALIEQDPLLSVEVLKLCNSAAFKRSDKEVTSLQQALVQVGRTQLRRFVTTCLSREMIDIKPIYFRRFGAQVWRHSMQVAFLASELAEEDAESAFLLGLLHDVGKIAIFKIIIDSFYQAEPGEQPRSLLFSQVMTTKSLTLSALLAKEWQLPTAFATNLAELANTNIEPQTGLSRVIWQANIISESSMLKQANKLPQATLEMLMDTVGISVEDFEIWHQKLLQF